MAFFSEILPSHFDIRNLKKKEKELEVQQSRTMGIRIQVLKVKIPSIVYELIHSSRTYPGDRETFFRLYWFEIPGTDIMQQI